MAAFELKTPDGAWLAIEPKTRVRYGDLYAPAVSEQIEILRLMNRPKDAPRIAALEALSVHRINLATGFPRPACRAACRTTPPFITRSTC